MSSSSDYVSRLTNKREKLKDEVKQDKDFITYLEKENKEYQEFLDMIEKSNIKTNIAKETANIIKYKIKYHQTSIAIRSGHISKNESDIRICDDKLMDNLKNRHD
jgi:hypothetical protein